MECRTILDRQTDKRIVITGGKGYISALLFDYLRQCGYTDIQRISIREDNFEIPDSDVLIHIAGIVPGKEQSEDDFYTINYMKTVRLVDQACMLKYKKIIYLSSMSIYNNNNQRKSKKGITIDTIPLPESAYAESKWNAERYIINHSDNMTYCILRVPSLYDNKKMEYFQNFSLPIKKIKVLPLFCNVPRVGILHLQNLVELIEIEVNMNDSKILLPQDEDLPTRNEISKKIAKINGWKTSYVLGMLIDMYLIIKDKKIPFRSHFYYYEEGLRACSKYSWHNVFPK